MSDRSKQDQGPEARGGGWPHLGQQFLWDLLPAKWVPSQSGLTEPEITLPPWADDGFMGTQEALETARSEHEWHRTRSATAEDKANRLAQTSLALLALALTLAGYQVAQLHDLGGGLLYGAILPILIAIAFICIAGVGALEVDRVGLYRFSQVRELVDQSDRIATLARSELRAAVLAAWTANHKYDVLVQARAWLSRGLVLLVASAVISGLLLAAGALSGSGHRGSGPNPAVTVSSSARTP